MSYLSVMAIAQDCLLDSTQKQKQYLSDKFCISLLPISLTLGHRSVDPPSSLLLQTFKYRYDFIRYHPLDYWGGFL